MDASQYEWLLLNDMNNVTIDLSVTIHYNVHCLFVHVTENIHDLCSLYIIYTKYHNTIYGTMKVIQEMMSDTVNILKHNYYIYFSMSTELVFSAMNTNNGTEPI